MTANQQARKTAANLSNSLARLNAQFNHLDLGRVALNMRLSNCVANYAVVESVTNQYGKPVGENPLEARGHIQMNCYGTSVTLLFVYSHTMISFPNRRDFLSFTTTDWQVLEDTTEKLCRDAYINIGEHYKCFSHKALLMRDSRHLWEGVLFSLIFITIFGFGLPQLNWFTVKCVLWLIVIIWGIVVIQSKTGSSF